MSYTTILGVTESGELEALEELKNGWGSAPVIWDAVAKSRSIDNYMFWSWTGAHRHESERILSPVFLPYARECEAWALALTYDCCIVSREQGPEVAKHLRAFFERYPVTSQRVNHWPRIIEILESMPEGVQGIGISHTSCGDTDLMGVYDEDADDRVPYNVHTHDKHFHLSREWLLEQGMKADA